MFSTQRRECRSAISNGGGVLLYAEEGVFSLYRGESFPMPCGKETDSFSIQRGECFFLHKAESVPLLYVEEGDSFSVQGRRCLLYTSESVPLLYVEGACSLYRV